MKGIKNPLVLPVLVAALILMLVGPSAAQTFTVLRSFNGSDGDNPNGSVILSATNLYGTTRGGGSSGSGTLYQISTDGTLFTNLYNFTAIAGPLNTNTDGANPTAGLLLAGNTLYGTAAEGG